MVRDDGEVVQLRSPMDAEGIADGLEDCWAILSPEEQQHVIVRSLALRHFARSRPFAQLLGWMG
jgi:hypothetical protein